MEIAKKAMKIKQSLAMDEEIARKLMMEEINRLNRTSPTSARKTTGHSTESKGSSAQVNGTENKENKALTSTSSAVKGPMDIFLGKKKIPSNSKKLVPIGSSDNVKAHLKNEKMTDGEKARSASGLSTGNGRIIEPKIVKITPMHLNFSTDDKSGKLPLQKLAASTRDVEHKFTSSSSTVVRELFHSGSSSEARGPSAFCETGALESEVGCEVGDNPTAAKVQKVDLSRVMVESCTLEEEKADVKGPERKRKRMVPCGEVKEGCSYGESSSNKLDPELQLMGVTKEIMEEQMRREAQLLQEQEDLDLARQLQSEWEEEVRRIDRRKGSQLEYDLRSRGASHSKDASRKAVGKSKRKQASGGPRQQSLDEIMSSKGKTKL
ncbi:hypothetical protein J437_LFUL015375 [Ladona fulva]|uniref:Uncharacterized protein n=1 Tax=Ladona fulva TaxID=123851 RepID=A0A8K0KK52_LADFU|nr:hypothetical protein J437_LFUL015375 [Ladona fulva]